MRHLGVVAVLVGAVGLTGCGEDTPMLISQDQEVAIGQEVTAEVYKEYGPPLTSGPQVARVQYIGPRILSQTRRTVPYSLTVLNNDTEINAFAAPGGPLFFTKGLVDVMSQDDELAFVIGHEAGHIEAEHGREAINQAVMVNAAASLLLNDQSQLQQLGAAVVWTLYSQGYSRQHEREADSLGLRFSAGSGYDPRGSVRALNKLGGGELRGPAKWLSSHPSTPERVRRLESQIASEYRK